MGPERREEVTLGGQAILELLCDWHARVDDLELKNVFLPAYHAGKGKMVQHGDKVANLMRTIHCLSADGTPRYISVTDVKGGVVRATVLLADGTVAVQKSKPGEALVLEVPSGGFYRLTGPGSGAAPSLLAWEHEVLVSHTDSLALIVDQFASYSEQEAAMHQMIAMLSGSVAPKPASMPNMSEVIDFETSTRDKLDGFWASMGHYWKLVDAGEEVHVYGRTHEEMKRLSDIHAGGITTACALPYPCITDCRV
jgi:hypothetical protein